MSQGPEPIVVEQFELLLARLQTSMNVTQKELDRMQKDEGRVAREAMGLHAALTEAIRRLNRMHIPCPDLLEALKEPGAAPLTWPNAEPPAPRPPTPLPRTQAELAAEYDRIYKRGDDA